MTEGTSFLPPPPPPPPTGAATASKTLVAAPVLINLKHDDLPTHIIIPFWVYPPVALMTFYGLRCVV